MSLQSKLSAAVILLFVVVSCYFVGTDHRRLFLCMFCIVVTSPFRHGFICGSPVQPELRVCPSRDFFFLHLLLLGNAASSPAHGWSLKRAPKVTALCPVL